MRLIEAPCIDLLALVMGGGILGKEQAAVIGMFPFSLLRVCCTVGFLPRDFKGAEGQRQRSIRA